MFNPNCNNFNNISPLMNMNIIPGMNQMMNFQNMYQQNPFFQMNNNNMDNQMPMRCNNNIMNMAGRNIMGMPNGFDNMNFMNMNNICINNDMMEGRINNYMNINDIINMFNNFLQRNNMNKNNINNNRNNNNNREGYIQIKVDDNNVINIKFITISEHNIIISIDKNRSLKYLFEEYAKRLGIPEIHLGKEITFILNGEIIDVKDTRPIHSLSSMDLITIIVIDPNEIIKKKYAYK